jgi:hypothetical protein
VGGYHVAFLVGAVFAAAGAVLGTALLRTRLQPEHAPRQAAAILEG